MTNVERLLTKRLLTKRLLTPSGCRLGARPATSRTPRANRYVDDAPPSACAGRCATIAEMTRRWSASVVNQSRG